MDHSHYSLLLFSVLPHPTLTPNHLLLFLYKWRREHHLRQEHYLRVCKLTYILKLHATFVPRFVRLSYRRLKFAGLIFISDVMGARVGSVRSNFPQ